MADPRAQAEQNMSGHEEIKDWEGYTVLQTDTDESPGQSSSSTIIPHRSERIEHLDLVVFDH